VYKTVTNGDKLFTMQPNFGAKMVKDQTKQDKTRQDQSYVTVKTTVK